MRILLVAFLSALAVPSVAQTIPAAGHAEVAKCLTPPVSTRGRPEYPANAVRARLEGTVQVDIEFTGPDAAPKVQVTQGSGSPELDASVVQYVSQYRAPCMQIGQPHVIARQQFEFRLDRYRESVSLTRLRIPGADDQRLAACVRRVDAKTRPTAPLQTVNAVVLAEAVFNSPDSEPQVAIVAPAASEPINEAVREFMRGYRMPCAAEAKVSTEQLFSFHPERPIRLETRLDEFLHLVRSEQKGSAQFDTSTMSCPFKVALEYWEPMRRNQIAEIGEKSPSRKPLLDKLAAMRVDAYPDLEKLMQADTLTISVPCGKIDL